MNPDFSNAAVVEPQHLVMWARSKLKQNNGDPMLLRLCQQVVADADRKVDPNYIHETLHRIWRLIDANEPVMAVQAIQAMLIATSGATARSHIAAPKDGT